jgi:hypothetical protein
MVLYARWCILDHPHLPQLRDRRRVVGQLRQYFVGVLAQHRGAVADRAGRLLEPHRRLDDRRGLRHAGEVGRPEEIHGLGVRIVERLLRFERRGGGNLGLAENLQRLGGDVIGAPARHAFAQHRCRRARCRP